MPPPADVSALRSFLGAVQFYGKFLPDLSTVAELLHSLTKRDTAWRWCNAEQLAFQMLKELLSANSVLVHFDPSAVIGI